MDTVLHIEHLSKRFGKRRVLKDISFDTYSGEVFGFLGPNGAGKSTTIKIAVGLLFPDEGRITVCGHDLATDFEAALSHVGGIVENPEFYPYLSGLENLRQYAAMHDGITEERIREVVHLVGLDNRIREKVKKYSLGMRQRLGVAQALLHRPRLLILDEPTNGLDPAGIKALRDLLCHLAHNEGVSVLVSSHLMSEMELMCDRIGMIVDGTLQSVQTVNELVSSSAPDHVEYSLHVSDSAAAAEILAEMDGIECTPVDAETLSLLLPTEQADNTLAAVNRALILGGISLFTTTKKENRRLEDVFIELTEKGGDQVG